MKNYFEKLLTAILLGTSVLLGLSFWLNIRFNFNIFSARHWDKLSALQASHTPVHIGFYISISIALLVFILGLYVIYRPRLRKISVNKNVQQTPVIKQSISETNTESTAYIPKTNPVVSQPPMLHLPKNTILTPKEPLSSKTPQKTSAPTPGRVTVYDAQLSQIFSDNKYLVKPNIKISGFTSNLFAIGNDEIVWIGAVDCDINVFKDALDKLQSVFTDTLEDIPITIYPFILDTRHIYDSDEQLVVFHDMEDLKNAISQHPNADVSETDQANFDAYSEYIDTIIQYTKKL